jgi:hypothetical protein
MNQVHQLANALLTVVFAAAMLLVGHLYIEKMSTRIPTINHAAQAFVLWTTPLQKLTLGEQSAHLLLVRCIQTQDVDLPLWRPARTVTGNGLGAGHRRRE